MKFALNTLALLLFLGIAAPTFGQVPDEIIMSDPDDPAQADEDRPLDGAYEKSILVEKRVLPYDHIREADVQMFQRRIWRVIDIREKMNLPFAYPERPFFTILQEAAENEEIQVYGTEDDKFSFKLSPQEVMSMGASIDTVITFDPVTYEEKTQIVRNELNPADIKRFRLKEDWFFDEETSTLQVRILGIAPLKEEYDENGELKYEYPMFWIYYPDARKVLAHEKAYTYGNDASPLSWEDIFEMRFFSSYIYKESNVFDRPLKEYLSGVDLLMEADRIKQEIFNYEHDLWTY